MKRKTLLAIAALAIAIPTTIYAATGGDDHKRCSREMHDKRHGGMPPFFKELNLTDSQKSQIQTIMKNENQNKEAQWKQRRELMKSMHDVANAEQLDNSKAEQIADQLAALEKQQALARAQKGHEIFNVLTPEQRTKMQAIMKKKMDKHDENMRPQHSQLQPAANALISV